MTAPVRVVCIDSGNVGSDADARIAQALSNVLEHKYGVHIVSSSDKPRVKADLCVRLHCHSGPDHGFALYFPDGQGTPDGVTGPSLGIIRSSRKAAYLVHAGMAEVFSGTLNDRGIRSELYTNPGSAFGQAPTVTVDMKYDEKGRKHLVDALAKGIMNYLVSLEGSSNTISALLKRPNNHKRTIDGSGLPCYY